MTPLWKVPAVTLAAAICAAVTRERPEPSPKKAEAVIEEALVIVPPEPDRLKAWLGPSFSPPLAVTSYVLSLPDALPIWAESATLPAVAIVASFESEIF